MLQSHSFAGTGIIYAAATFLRYESGSAPGLSDAIRLRADGSDLGVFRPGDSVRITSAASRWEIEPVAGALCVGVIRLGTGSIDSARIIGDVRVIDSSAKKTEEGKQFLRSNFRDAGAFQCVCALAANGVRVAIRRMFVLSDVAGDVMMCSGSGIGTSQFNNQVSPNKLVGGPNSVALVCAGTAVASTLLTPAEMPGCVTVSRFTVQANQVFSLDLNSSPIIIGDTKTIAFLGLVNTRALSVAWEFEEL